MKIGLVYCFLLTLFSLQTKFLTAEEIPNTPLSLAVNQVEQENTITTSRYVTGGLVGSFVGFGTGHAIQRRYEGKGELFTYGEIGSLGLMLAGALTGDCQGQGSPVCGDVGAAGFVAFMVFRVWEMVDVWILPASVAVTKDLAYTDAINGDGGFRYNSRQPLVIGFRFNF